MDVIEQILEGANPRELFLEDESRKTRFPVDVKQFDLSQLTDDQKRKIKENSKRIFRWMKEFVAGSGLDSCDIILKPSKDQHLYMEITPEAVAFTPNLYKYTVSDYADDETLGLVVLNWEAIKERIKGACEWLRRNKKEKEENPDSLDSRLASFTL